MMIRKALWAAFSCAILLGTAQMSLADYVDAFLSETGSGMGVDDFKLVYKNASPPPINTSVTTNTNGEGILGGVRTATINVTTTVDGTATAFIDSAGGIKFALSPEMKATFTLKYDSSGSGLGDVDRNLSGMGGIVLEGLKYDEAHSDTITVNITVDDGTNVRTASTAVQGITSQDVPFLFTDLSFAGIDFSHIRSISIEFDAPAGADFSLAGISFINGAVVPEPGAVAVWLMVGLVGLAYGLRMYRRQPVRQGD